MDLLEFLRLWRLRALALAALLGGPGFFFVQTFFSHPDATRPTEPAWPAAERTLRERSNSSESALAGKSGEAAALVDDLLKHGEHRRAEAWLLYGAAELRSPALMLYYADFLRRHAGAGGRSRALAWYARAELTAGGDRPEERNFRAAVQQQRRELETEGRHAEP